MLELDKRPCHIGNSMSTNTEKHGEDDESAIDLPLDGIMLKAAELDALLGAGAHKALFIYPQPNGNEAPLPEIRFTHLKPFAFTEHFENASVQLWLGYDEDDTVSLFGCKIRNVKLTPQAGGYTMLGCSVRAKPDGEDVATLYDYLNQSVAVEISDAKKAEKAKSKQQNLSLGEQPDTDGDDEGEEAGAEA